MLHYIFADTLPRLRCLRLMIRRRFSFRRRAFSIFCATMPLIICCHASLRQPLSCLRFISMPLTPFSCMFAADIIITLMPAIIIMLCYDGSRYAFSLRHAMIRRHE